MSEEMNDDYEKNGAAAKVKQELLDLLHKHGAIDDVPYVGITDSLDNYKYTTRFVSDLLVIPGLEPMTQWWYVEILKPNWINRCMQRVTSLVTKNMYVRSFDRTILDGVDENGFAIYADEKPHWLPWKQIGGDSQPIGSFTWWFGTADSIPQGYVLCDGRSCDAYPALKLLIGDNVPNLIGKFVKGGNQANVEQDANATVNLPNGNIGEVVTATTEPSSPFVKGACTGYVLASGIAQDANWRALYSVSMNNTTISTITGDTEIRPKNVTALPIIKAW